MTALNLAIAICLITTASLSKCFVYRSDPKSEELSLEISERDSAQDKSACTTADGTKGECVEIRECKPIINLLKSYANSNKTPPAHVYDNLRKLRCNVGINSVTICCATTPIIKSTPKPKALVKSDDKSSCTTPDGSEGNCVEIRECSSVIKLLESYKNINTSLPNHVYDYLRKIKCNVGTSSIKVCCANKPLNLKTDAPSNSKPEELIQLDNSEDDKACTTPDGSHGNCVAIRECNPVVKLLESYTNTNTSLPNHVYDYLRKIKCNVGLSSLNICCATKTINLNASEPIDSKPEKLIQLDNSEEDKACTTPGGSQGNCVGIRECKPVMNLLQSYANTNTTLPQSIYDYLRKIQCNIGSSVNVCCPIKQETPNYEKLLPLDECGKNFEDDKVAFGSETSLFDYPWMVQLAYLTDKGIEYLCGGTLISDRYVLTAAHCIPRNRRKINLLYVRLGEHNMSSPIDCTKPQLGYSTCAVAPQDIPIETELPHPNFDYLKLSNDIALLRLRTKADTSEDTVTPICLPVLPSVRHANLSSLTVTGWGLTENNTRSDVLLQGKVSIMDKKTCENFYTNINVTDFQICVEDGSGIGSCRGDSGGPLLTMQDFNGSERYVQYGVVSVGPKKCGAQGLPGIHTRIDYYIDWILNNMKP